MKKDWTHKKFADIFNLNMGKTPARANEKYWTNGKYPWVSISDLSSGNKYITNTKEKISQEAVDETRIYLVPKGTVIMSFKLSIGKTAIAPFNLYTNEAIMAFEPKDGVDIIPDFLYYYLQYYKWSGNRAVMGETINKAVISNSYACIPPISIQESIVRELDAIHGILEKKQEQLRELDNLTQAIFYDMFGDPITNPKQWEVKKLGEVTYIGLGFTHTPTYVDNGVPFLSVKDITNGKICWENIKYVSHEEYKSAPKGALPKKGDILFCRVGTLGKPIIVDTERDFCTFVSLGYLRINQTVANNIYVKCWMESDAFISQVNKSVKGVAIKNLNTGWLKEFVIPLPPLSLQQSFAAKIEAIEAQKQTIQQSIREVEALLAERIDHYFS